MTCGHTAPTFGCRACIAKATPTKVNEALAADNPQAELGSLRQDRMNRDSLRAKYTNMRANIRADRIDAALQDALEYRLKRCGHEVLVFECDDCFASEEQYKIRMEKQISAVRGPDARAQ